MKIIIVKNEFMEDCSLHLSELEKHSIFIFGEPKPGSFSIRSSEDLLQLGVKGGIRDIRLSSSEECVIFVHAECVNYKEFKETTDMLVPQYSKGVVKVYTVKAIEESRFYSALAGSLMNQSYTEDTMQSLKHSIRDLTRIPWHQEYFLEISLRLCRLTEENLSEIKNCIVKLKKIIGGDWPSKDNPSAENDVKHITDTLDIIIKEFERKIVKSGDNYWDLILERPDLYDQMYNSLKKIAEADVRLLNNIEKVSDS